MAVHFLSVLGSGLYEPIRYQNEDFTSGIQEYVQLAVIEKHKDELMGKDARITIFVTNDARGSRKANLEDRDLTSFDKNKMKDWNGCEASIKSETEKYGLYSQLQIRYPELSEKFYPCDIEVPSTKDNIYKVFQSIYNELREGDEIIFDITHSLRSIPMLAMTVINYAKVMKDCTLRRIYYGAYEAATEDKIAPLVDLTMYDDILEWTNAANEFISYGIAGSMRDVFKKKMRYATKAERIKWAKLKSVSDDAALLSETILASRGCGNRGDDMPADTSIQAAIKRYKNSCGKMSGTEIEIQEFAPLYPLIQKTQDAYAQLDYEENYRTGLAVVNWCINHDMVQQGYTALEETIITYICKKYQFDENEQKYRVDIVNQVIGILSYAISGKIDIDNPEMRMQLFDRYFSLKGNTNNQEECLKFTQMARELIAVIDIRYVQILGKLKEYRNDINHFGMRSQPKSTKALKSKLTEYSQEFIALLEQEGV